jgi:hypothetical protein
MEVTEEMRELLASAVKCLYAAGFKPAINELDDLRAMMTPPPQHEVRTWHTSTAGLFYVYCTCGDIFYAPSGIEAMQLFQTHRDKKLNG